MSFAASPQHMAVRLCLTVATTKIFRGYASIPRQSLRMIIYDRLAGKPEAFRYVLRRSRRLTPAEN
jgi:hypothetical protein